MIDMNRMVDKQIEELWNASDLSIMSEINMISAGIDTYDIEVYKTYNLI
jgi:hypothetical protein